MRNDCVDVELAGCAPVPLAHYLKALGVLRLVAEQADPNAQGWWRGDSFWLRSRLDQGGLVRFFLDDYQPSPLVGPWGARSGFFPSASERTAREALERIAASSEQRLSPFRHAIQEVRTVLRSLDLDAKAETPEQKRALMMACRAQLPDELLAWLDATYVLLEADTKYPPLLGTGGNEGSGSYMSGFAQQLAAVLIDRAWDHALAGALFGVADSGMSSGQTPGHFSPEAAGGPNASQGFEGSVEMNPWDYLLLLEGTLLFAAAAVKKLEGRDPGALGFPFCVRAAGVGYASATTTDEAAARAEMWFPIWSRPATVSEISFLFSEGRATVNGRAARSGVDFARAIASYGVDRGIPRFERYGFQQRNGLSYFAVPLGSFRTALQPDVDLLNEIDRWLDRFRRAARSANAPARAGRALRRLEGSILDLCQEATTRQVQNVLIALGEAEAAIAASPKMRDRSQLGAFVDPVPLLSPQWLADAYDETAEFRLAAALVGIGGGGERAFRRHLEPVEVKKRSARWEENPDKPTLVWGGGDLVRNLLAVLTRRVVEAIRDGGQPGDEGLLFPGKSRCSASLGDIAAFIEGRVDDRRIESLVRGLMLLDWRDPGLSEVIQKLRGDRDPIPNAAYGLLKLCHLPHTLDGVAIPLTPTITRRAAAGDVQRATELAARRLRGSGLVPIPKRCSLSPPMALRTAAALLFPVWYARKDPGTKSKSDVHRLAGSVLRRTEPAGETDGSEPDPAETL